MRQSACLVINPIMVDNLQCSCTLKLHGGESDFRLYDGHDLKLFFLVGWDRSSLSSVVWYTRAQLMIFFASYFQCCCLAVQGSPTVTQHVVSVEPSSLLHHSDKTRFIRGLSREPNNRFNICTTGEAGAVINVTPPPPQ